jgi:hypothetical protein
MPLLEVIQYRHLSPSIRLEDSRPTNSSENLSIGCAVSVCH